MKKAIKESNSKKSLRMTKPAYVLWSSVQKVAGFFSLMHDLMELSGRRCILMLEKREEVYKNIVESEYGPRTTLFVKNWMERWIPLAHHLYHITDICHSQGKVDKEKLYKLKTHIASFVKNWFEFMNYKNPIFWKLRLLMCGLILCAEKYHMI